MVGCPDAPYRYLKNYKVIHDLLLNEPEKQIVKGFRLNKMWRFSLILKVGGPEF